MSLERREGRSFSTSSPHLPHTMAFGCRDEQCVAHGFSSIRSSTQGSQRGWSLLSPTASITGQFSVQTYTLIVGCTGAGPSAPVSGESKTHQLAGRQRGHAARTGPNIPGRFWVGETRQGTSAVTHCIARVWTGNYQAAGDRFVLLTTPLHGKN